MDSTSTYLGKVTFADPAVLLIVLPPCRYSSTLLLTLLSRYDPMPEEENQAGKGRDARKREGD